MDQREANQRIQKALQVYRQLTKVKETEDLSAADVVKAYIKVSGSVYDEDELDQENGREKAIEAFMDLYEKFEAVAGELAKGKGSQPKAQSVGANFDQMKVTMNSIVRIQAMFRKILTMKRLERQVRDQRAAMQNKKTYETPEESALREFTQQLANKNMTPEAFFRVCDQDYKQTVQAATFKDQIQKLGLKLSRGQLSRIIMILDEDMEGNITRQEYYDALEAYNVSGEKHKSLDPSQAYQPFEHRALFKLISELKRKNIEYLEMFNACDVNDDRRVNINEVSKFVEGLSPDIKQKELHALMSYLDIDKNGIVEKDEFLRQLNKGEQTYRQQQILNKSMGNRKTQSMAPSRAVDNFFQEEAIGAGDQAFAGMDSMNDRVGSRQDKPPAKDNNPTDPDEKKRKMLIEKMEREGQNFTQFFQGLKRVSKNGLIPLGGVLKALEAAYPTLTQNDRNFLVKTSMGGCGKIDYIALESLFTRYSKNLKPSVSQTFSLISNYIVSRMGGQQPLESIKQFLRANDVSENDSISETEFLQIFSGKIQALNPQDLEQGFKQIDTDYDGFVDVSDLIDTLLSYSDNSKSGLNLKEVSALIPGLESMSPRTRCEELISFIINELEKKNLKPINVFKMADTKNAGSSSAETLIKTFQKILPTLKQEVLAEAFGAFNLINMRDSISRQDFETVFTHQGSGYIPNSQALSSKGFQQNQSASPQKSQPASQDEDDMLKWIRKQDNAMLRERISPGVAFKAADLNHNGVVTVDELKETFKKLIPQDTMSLADLKKVMMAFDQNRNGLIEEQEFISLIEKARNSNLTIVESPQRMRQDVRGDQRSLPTKNSMQSQSDYIQIDEVVAELDKKLDLKSFFSQLTIDEAGNVMVTQISRGFKTAETFDKKGLQPSEYMPVIKNLDAKQSGQVQVKDILKFLEKYSSSYEGDCKLELKFIANFIEFQAKSRYTKTFILNNSKLQPDKRLLEVELMTELSKMFGISMQIGRIIFNKLQKLKGKGDVTLDGLCKLIDENRVVPVDSSSEPKGTQAKKLDNSKVLLKFVINLMKYSERKRGEINNQIVSIAQQQKAIPYKEFFDLFVTDLQIIDIPESKALFEHLRQLSNKNMILLEVFQLQIQKTQDSIQEAQFSSFGNTLVQDSIFEGLTKVKMNDQGYLSKNNFRQYLEYVGVLNKKGTNPQDSEYCRHLRNLLMQEDLEVPPQLQADEFIEQLLINEGEACKFWSVIEIMAKASERHQLLASVIFKYLGKIFDMLAPNESTTSAIQQLNPKLTLADGMSLIQLIQAAQDTLSKKNPGFNQGMLREHSKECIEAIYSKFVAKQTKITEDHPLIQQINRHRALLGKGTSQQQSAPSNEASADHTDLVKQLEAQMGQKLEDVVHTIYDQDQVTILSFQRLLLQVSPNVDKGLSSQVCQAIDVNKTRMVQVRDFFNFMKAVQGRFNLNEVLTQLANDIEEPVQKTIEHQGIQPSETYQKSDILDCLSQLSNISKFHALGVFYELAGQNDSLPGKVLIQKIQEAKEKLGPKKNIKLNDSREEKKSVRFVAEPSPRDLNKDKATAQSFLEKYAQIGSKAIVESGLDKLSKFLKPVKSEADCLAKFDPSGKGLIGVSSFIQKLDQIPQMNDLEKLCVAFLPCNQNKADIFQVNVKEFITVAKKFDKSQGQQFLSVLGATQKAVQQQISGKPEEKKGKSKSSIEAAYRKHDLEIEKKLPIVIPFLRNLAKDPKRSAELIKKFEDAPNQKLTYMRFNDYLEQVLKVGASEQELESKRGLSKLMKEKRGKTSSINHYSGQKLTCEMLEYTIVPERDYFIPGVSTILNNERAALVMAEKIFNELGKDEEFFDKDFGPKDENDIQGNRMSIYCTGEPPKGYVDPDGIEWLRPEDITDEPPQFFDDGPAPNDVRQGKLGDCWFIGALSVLATRDDLLRGGIGNIEIGPDFEVTNEIADMFSQGVYPPMFHYYRKKGIYVFRFFKEFNWRYVIIDDRIPCFSYSRKPVFGTCKQLHELWVPLLEKAYAKIHGCYESLISGFIDDALTDLTGLVAEKLLLHNENKVFPHRTIKDKETFWKYLIGLSSGEQESMLGCSVVGDTEREIIQDGFKTGIMTGHAYGIIDVFEFKSEIKTHRLLRIRNPWGNMEWKGKWSDKSEEMEKHAQLMHDQYISKLAEEERFEPGEDDGTFLMNYQSWRDIFNNMYVCVDFPESWNAIRFRSAWDASCSGGVPSPMTPENMKKWAQNPQYQFYSTVDSEIFISLAQTDGRAKRPNGQYLKFPYAECIFPILFTVCELPQGKDRLDAFDKNLVKGASVLKQHKEVSLRLQLPAGRYVIVPATRQQGQYGDYTLSIYFSAEDEDVEVTRIDKPEEEFTLIAEETERTDNVPEWKLDLTQKRIKYMFVSEDNMNDSQMNNSTSFAKSGMKLSVAMEKSHGKKKGQDFDEKEAFPDDEVIE